MKTTLRVKRVARRKRGKTQFRCKKERNRQLIGKPAGRKATNVSSCCVTGSRLNIDILQPAKEEVKKTDLEKRTCLMRQGRAQGYMRSELGLLKIKDHPSCTVLHEKVDDLLVRYFTSRCMTLIGMRESSKEFNKSLAIL